MILMKLQAGMTEMNARLTTTVGSVLLSVLLLSPAAMLSAQQPPAKHSLPPLTVDLRSVSYPSALQRQGVQGRVLVAFNITKRGKVDDPVVVSGEPAGEFDSVAIKAVKQVHFTVPDDWEASGDSAYQYQFSVLFKLSPCIAPACVAPKPHEAADDFLVIGAEAK
jgi:TonB family protein